MVNAYIDQSKSTLMLPLLSRATGTSPLTQHKLDTVTAFQHNQLLLQVHATSAACICEHVSCFLLLINHADVAAVT